MSKLNGELYCYLVLANILFTIDMVNDTFSVNMNDDYKGYHEIGTKAEMDVFNGR